MASNDPVWKPLILANLAAFRQAMDQQREMQRIRADLEKMKRGRADPPACKNPAAEALLNGCQNKMVIADDIKQAT
jgi:hypothetical protein